MTNEEIEKRYREAVLGTDRGRDRIGTQDRLAGGRTGRAPVSRRGRSRRGGGNATRGGNR